MRIGLVIRSIDTNGGVQKNYKLLFELFKSYGHETYLFVLDSPKLITIEDENIIFLEGKYLFQKGISLRNSIHHLGKFNLLLVNAIQLKKYLKEQNYFVTVHNTWSKKVNWKNIFKRRKRLKELNYAFKNNNIIGISKGVVDDVINVLKIPVHSFQTIYAPHDFEKVRELADKNVEIESNYILGIGGLQKRKRFDLLIRAYQNILKVFPCYKLIIVGNGSEENTLKELVTKLSLQNQVFFTGFKENPYPYIKNSKLLVSCSQEEGLPRVLVEALTLNVPVVSTKSSSSIVEVLSNELEQFICEVDNQKSLEDIMVKALTNYPKIKESMFAKFNQHIIYKQYLNLAKE